jgi:hypothetical protein
VPKPDTLTYDVDSRRRRSVPWGSLLLLVAVVAVAAVLVVWVAAGGRQSRVSPPGVATSQALPSPTWVTSPESSPPSGSDANEELAVPAGSREAASRFVTAWLDPNPASRKHRLDQVAVPALTEGLMLTARADIPTAKPAGGPVLEDASTYSVQFVQTLTDSSRIRIYLVADPAARYGWLATSVEPA